MGTESPDPPDDDDSAPDRTDLTAELDTENLAFVDELNADIATHIETSPGLEYEYIIGDISDYDVSANGHGHFDLVHDDATIRCVVFQSRRNRVEDTVEDGLLAAVKGDLSFYEDGGDVSLLVSDVVDVGIGRYQQTYEANKQALEEAGCLDEDAKQPLPRHPTRVGIVTSAESAARDDVVTSIHATYPGIDLIIQDTAVQGDTAMVSMMDAITQLDDQTDVDMIVVTRGGGAEKHLRVFNETPLCRVIHETDTPVVAGIGHESDRTLADDVADKRVMTPTDVGDVIPEKATLTETLGEYDASLQTAYNQLVTATLSAERQALSHRYEQLAAGRLQDRHAALEQAYNQLVQQKTHEQEKAEAVEQYQHTTRRQRLIIAALVVLLLAVLALFLTTL